MIARADSIDDMDVLRHGANLPTANLPGVNLPAATVAAAAGANVNGPGIPKLRARGKVKEVRGLRRSRRRYRRVGWCRAVSSWIIASHRSGVTCSGSPL
jgi:hypothetical protein